VQARRQLHEHIQHCTTHTRSVHNRCCCYCRLAKKLVGAVDEYDGDRFFTRPTGGGRRVATPLLLCLVCIELSDFVFAVDSIPAVLGVSQDPFVVYSSNIFAIMGLRSVYTIVARAIDQLPYLKVSAAVWCYYA
jgi:predicted tellurium resistance membrane protein TerC